jgi:predicted nucleic acid-binding protein
MGRLIIPDGARLYLDANIIIHIVEAQPKFKLPIDELAGRQKAGSISLATSSLSLAEVLVQPLKEGNAPLAQIYKEFLQSDGAMQLLPITSDDLIRAAELRSLMNYKLPDAIHMAAAVAWGAAFFLSEDRRIRSSAALKILRMDDLSL